MKSGCSTAGCHTANVTISGEMQVGEQARHTHYSSSMRFFSHELRKRRTEW